MTALPPAGYISPAKQRRTGGM